MKQKEKQEKRNIMKNLSNEQKVQLRIEVAKLVKLSSDKAKAFAEKLCIKYSVSTMQLAGVKASLKREENKPKVDEVALFKANEKRTYKKRNDKLIKKIIEGGLSTVKQNNTNNGDFTNVNGESKKETRNIIFKYFKPNSKPNLSLPFECDLEKLILSKYPNQNFIGFEKKKTYFDNALNIIKDNHLPIDLILGNINDYVKSSKTESFSNLLLDYCGSFLSNADTVRYAVENDLVPRGGIIAITSMRANRGKKTQAKQKYLYDTINNNGGDNRCASDKDNETYLHKLCGINNKYSLVEVHYYKDSSSMVLYILRRNF